MYFFLFFQVEVKKKKNKNMELLWQGLFTGFIAYIHEDRELGAFREQSVTITYTGFYTGS